MNHSALRTLEILEYLAASGEARSISEISRDLGYPKNSVFDIVGALLEKGFIRVDDPKLKTYTVGLSAYRVGMSYINRADLYSIAHGVLTDLKNELGETVYLAVEDHGSVVYLDKIESSQPLRSACSVGSKKPMYLTGLGKAMLAGYDDERILAFARGPFERRTETTLCDFDTLMQDIEQTRKRGYAVDNGEDVEIIRCVAAPIRNARNETVAAISVSMLYLHFTPEVEERVSRALVDAALQISRQLGYTKSQLYK